MPARHPPIAPRAAVRPLAAQCLTGDGYATGAGIAAVPQPESPGRTSTVSNFHTQLILSGDSDASKGKASMLTFATADLKEARSFRIAQCNGRTATVTSGRAPV